MKHSTGQQNKGFSLMELIVAIAIISILTGMSTLGISAFLRQNVVRYAREIKNQIEMTKTQGQSRMEPTRLHVYVADNAKGVSTNYCAIEVQAENGSWSEIKNSKEDLGAAGSITITSEDTDGGYILFDQNTGEMIDPSGNLKSGTGGAGFSTFTVSGYGAVYKVVTYWQSGYVEITS